MLLKLVSIVVIFGIIWLVLFRTTSGRKSAGRDARRSRKLQDLVKCKACGIYLPADTRCTCTDGK